MGKPDATATASTEGRGRPLLLGGLTLAIAAAIWLPLVHFLFLPERPPAPLEANVSALAEPLLAQHLHLWNDLDCRQQELAKMRGSNAEWDFMGRSFLVWALANVALRQPDRQVECLGVMDRIIDETLLLEREKGLYHFLMPYAQARAFAQEPARSLFLDGEIALMLALRRLAAEHPPYRPLLHERVRLMEERMWAGPVLCAESYPDECWLFCNAVALAAMRVTDHLDGSDHSRFFAEWVAMARQKLIDPRTGLLISSFTLDGRPKDGPEGTCLWMAAHCLQLIDPEFARDQYERARKELAGGVCGFGFGREWPATWRGGVDVDSGPIVPLLDASAGSSGLAFVAARAFDDRDYYRSLQTSLGFAAFPITQDGRLRYGASNQVGDAVILYSAVLGPAWRKVGAAR